MMRDIVSGRTFRIVGLTLAATFLGLAQPVGPRRTDASPPVQGQPEHKTKYQPVRGQALDADEKLAEADIYLVPEGFMPGELTVPAGPVLLSLKKRLGPQNGASLELRAEESAKVVWRAEMAREVPKLSEIVRLRPGRYTLTAASGDDAWSCRITVTPRGRS